MEAEAREAARAAERGSGYEDTVCQVCRSKVGGQLLLFMIQILSAVLPALGHIGTVPIVCSSPRAGAQGLPFALQPRALRLAEAAACSPVPPPTGKPAALLVLRPALLPQPTIPSYAFRTRLPPHPPRRHRRPGARPGDAAV